MIEVWLANQYVQFGALFAFGVIVASAIWAWRYNVRAHRSFEEGLSQQAEHSAAQQRLLEERLDIRAREFSRLESRSELLDEQLKGANAALHERTRELAERQAAQAALEGMGHTVQVRGTQGTAHSIMVDPQTGMRIGAPDPRGDDAGAAGH